MPLFLNASELELLGRLNDSHVRYMVVGGHAVSFHGHLRSMKDLDIWIEPTTENASRVANALAVSGIYLSDAQIERLAKPKLQVPIGGLYIELLTSCGELGFDEAMARAVAAIENGVQCHVISKADLVAVKRLLAREQDLEDVANLEKQ